MMNTNNNIMDKENKEPNVAHKKNGKRYIVNPTKMLARDSTQEKIKKAGKAFDRINSKAKDKN